MLDIFHVRWQGFGAALLVRLVEALLGNASREFLATLAPPTNETDAGPAEATSSTGASRGQGGDERDGIAASCTASKNGTIVGLERQALFFGLWVRHLLSNRWHMRSGDVRIFWRSKRISHYGTVADIAALARLLVRTWFRPTVEHRFHFLVGLGVRRSWRREGDIGDDTGKS